MKKYVQVVTQLKQREEITFNQKTNQKKKKRSSYSMNNFNVRLSSLNNILKCKLSMHRLTIEFQFKTMQFTPVIVGHIQALEYIKQ